MALPGQSLSGLYVRAISPSTVVSSRSWRGLGSSTFFGALRGAGGEGAVACYGLAYYEGVHVVRALVGVDALDVGHVLHHAVVEQDTVAPEDLARRGRDAARLRDVVHL